MTSVDLTTAQLAPDFTESLVQAKAKKEEHELLSLDNVVGVGLGFKETGGVITNQRCIQVFVEQKVGLDLLASASRVPKTVDRRPTDVVAVGTIFAGGGPHALGSVQSLTGRRRPAMGGDSVGHFAISAGTAGTGCYDSTVDPGIPPRYYILSNNHVLANSNDASIGAAIYQPGPHDGGGPSDQIGTLHHYVPIKFDGTDNQVDAAVAEVPFHDFTREIYYLGYVDATYAPVAVGDIVKKTGRTTNFTTGRVTSVNADRQRQLRRRQGGEVRQPGHHDLDERRRRLGKRGARLGQQRHRAAVRRVDAGDHHQQHPVRPGPAQRATHGGLMTGQPSLEAFAAALKEAESLLAIEGVEGVGQGATDDGAPSILVLSTALLDPALLPETIAGFPVGILDIGDPPTALDHGAAGEVELPVEDPSPDDSGEGLPSE